MHGFYKSEKIHAYAKSSICVYITFRMKSTESFINKTPGLLLSGPKSSFQMKVNFAFIWKSRSQSLEEERRGTESTLLEVQCEVSTVSDDLGCHVICWCWSTVFSEVHS